VTLTQEQILAIKKALRPMFSARRKLADYHNNYRYESTFSAEYAQLCSNMLEVSKVAEENVIKIVGKKPYINLIDFVDRYILPTNYDIPKLYSASI